MGFLDRLEQIGRGAVDLVSAPLGIPIDLVRMIPDDNMTFGRAFGGNLEQFTQGMAGVAQGTGISGASRFAAEHTPVDDVLGEVLFQAEALYNQELQLATNRAPIGFDAMGLEPGDLSIARVAGAAGSIYGQTTNKGMFNVGRNMLREGVEEAASDYLTNVRQSYNRTDPRIMGLSPGQALSLSTSGAINLPEEELRTYMGSTGFKMESMAIDAIARWYLQPEVIAGKGIKTVRARWKPDIARYVSKARSMGLEIKEVVPEGLEVTQVTGKGPRLGVEDWPGPQDDSGIDYLLGLVDQERTGLAAGDGPQVSRLIRQEADKLLDRNPKLKWVVDNLNETLDDVEFHTVDGVMDESIDEAVRSVTLYDSELKNLVEGINKGKNLRILETDYEASQYARAHPGEVAFSTETNSHFEAPAGSVPQTETANLSGAVNLQLRNPNNKAVYHVTTQSNYRNIQEHGLLRVPPGAEDLIYNNTRLATTLRRLEQEFPELLDENGVLDPSKMDDVATEFNQAWRDLEFNFKDEFEAWLSTVADPDEVARLRDQGFMLDEIPEMMGIDPATMPGNLQEYYRLAKKLAPDSTELLEGQDLEDWINLATSPLERKVLATTASHHNTEVTRRATYGPAFGSDPINPTMGTSAPVGLGDPNTPLTQRVIYLLGEDDFPEAMRYAAALYAETPGDPPVILKINPEGLPVIFDDFTQPLLPDARSGLPSDASLITRVDKIDADNIIEVIMPAEGYGMDELATVFSEGRNTPAYLEPGGRLHERLYSPNGKPIRPEDMMDYADVEAQFLGMTEAYNTGGAEESMRFARAAYMQRNNQGPGNLMHLVMNDKRFQIAINNMDGMDADTIYRVYFGEVAGGVVLSDMLSQVGTYEGRRQILLAAAGIFDPETTMLPHITRARIRALRNTVEDLKTSPEYYRYKKDLELGMVDELDQANLQAFNELEVRVQSEIDDLTRQGEFQAFSRDVRLFVPLTTVPRGSPGRLRESIRTSHWYQNSALARPIRSVVEKRPHRFVNMHDPDGHIQVVRQLEEGAPLGITPETVSKYRNRYMAATNEAEKVRILNQMDNELVRAAASKAGLDEADIQQLLFAQRRGKATVADLLNSRRYSPDEGGDLIRFYDSTSGEFVEMAMPLVSTQLQNWVPLTDVRELIRVSNQVRRYTSRFNQVPRELMDTFTNIWKPSVLLRGGWPIRVVSDEQIRILARTGSLIAHLASIEAGELPAWGFANIFGGGRTGPQRFASTFTLPVSLATAGGARLATGVSRGARKLGMLNPQYWDDLVEAGTENLASSRASYAGPNESILQEGASLWGSYEIGIMDHLITSGTGQWTTVAKGHHQYFAAWKRALQDQLGRDELAGFFLRANGDETARVVRFNPNYIRIKKGLREVFDAQDSNGVLAALDDADFDELATSLFEEYETMSRSQFGVRGPVDPMELESTFMDLVESRLRRSGIDEVGVDPISGEGIFNYDKYVLAEELAGRIQGWEDEVIDKFADFAQVRQGGTLHPGYIGEQMSMWFEDIIGSDWINNPRFVDIYNKIAVRWKSASLGDIDDVAIEVRRVFNEYIAQHPEDAMLNAIQSEMLPSWVDDFKAVYKGSWASARSVEMPASQSARTAAKAWLLNTTEGREYAARMPWRTNLDAWMDDVEQMVRTYTSDYSEGLSEAALSGRVTRSVLESVDEGFRPPSVHAEVIEQAVGNSVVTRMVQEFTSTSFDTLGRMTTDTLSRHPFFRQRYADEMRRIRNLMDAQGIPLTEDALRNMSVQSRTFALREVKKWLYDLSESSRFGQMMRWFIPFYPAWQEVLEVWGGLIARDPSIIGRGLLVWRAPNKLGIVEEDDEGNEFITFRLSEKVTENMGLEGWQKYIAEGGIRFGKNSFNMITSNPFPSVGPPIQVPVNEIVKNRPDLESALRFILPYGVKTNAFDVITSPLVKRAGALISGPSGDASYQRDWTNAIIWLDWRFRTGESTVPPSYEEAHDIAKKIWTIRLFANLTAPAQPIFDTPLKPYIDIYREMIETLGPEEADVAFLDQYGKEFFAVTLSRTVSLTGIPPTIEGQAARQRYNNLISKYPEYGRFIIGEDAAIGEFSSAAFAWQMTNPPTDDPSFFGQPDRQYRDLELDPERGTITEVDRRLGWQEYIQAMDLIDLERRKRGLPNLRVKEARDLTIMKTSLTNGIAEKYPEWWRDFNQRNDLKWNDRIKAMRDISKAVLFTEDRADMEGVQLYLEARGLILAELNHRGQLGNSSTLEAKENEDLRMTWETLVAAIVEDNIAFLPVYYRYLEGDTVQISTTEVNDG